MLLAMLWRCTMLPMPRILAVMMGLALLALLALLAMLAMWLAMLLAMLLAKLAVLAMLALLLALLTLLAQLAVLAMLGMLGMLRMLRLLMLLPVGLLLVLLAWISLGVARVSCIPRILGGRWLCVWVARVLAAGLLVVALVGVAGRVAVARVAWLVVGWSGARCGRAGWPVCWVHL